LILIVISSAERGSEAKRVNRFNSAAVRKIRVSIKFRASSRIVLGVIGFIIYLFLNLTQSRRGGRAATKKKYFLRAIAIQKSSLPPFTLPLPPTGREGLARGIFISWIWPARADG
jgi:hypothetical protein